MQDYPLFWLAVLVILPLPLLWVAWRKINFIRWESNYQAGMKAFQRNEHAEAARYWSAALKIAEKLRGVHRLTKTLNELGTVYQVQERYDDAEHVHKLALEIREKFLGPDHYEVAQSLSNLGLVYTAQGKHRDAELAYKRAIAILENALGTGNPQLAGVLASYADLLREMGRQDEAEEMAVRSNAIINR